MKHKRRYQLIIIAAIAVLIPVLIYNTDIRKVDDYDTSGTGSIASGARTASISIQCGVLSDHMDIVPKELKDAGFIPADGVVLEQTAVALEDGESAFDLLLKVTRQKKIQMEFSGSPGGGLSAVYIKSINNIYEFSCGPLSGWMFKVNGAFSGEDSSSIVLADGDLVEWVFTCDMGRDIGNSIGGEESE